MPNVLLVNSPANPIPRDALDGLRADWRRQIAGSYRESHERLQLHPVDALVVPIEDLEDEEFRKLLRAAGRLDVPVIVHGVRNGDLQQIVEEGASGAIPRADLGHELPSLLAYVMQRRQSKEHHKQSTQGERRIAIQIDNQRCHVPHLVQMLLDECEQMRVIDTSDRFKVGVALEEAIVNAIVHGNLEVSSDLRERDDDLFEQTVEQRAGDPRYKHRTVRITTFLTPACAEFCVEDQGPGFDVASIPDPTAPENLMRPSGRGLLLMRTFMDDVSYNADGNCVTLRKRASSAVAQTNHPAEVESCALT